MVLSRPPLRARCLLYTWDHCWLGFFLHIFPFFAVSSLKENDSWIRSTFIWSNPLYSPMSFFVLLAVFSLANCAIDKKRYNLDKLKRPKFALHNFFSWLFLGFYSILVWNSFCVSYCTNRNDPWIIPKMIQAVKWNFGTSLPQSDQFQFPDCAAACQDLADRWECYGDQVSEDSAYLPDGSGIVFYCLTATSYFHFLTLFLF